MHHFIRASDIRPKPAFSAEASGYRRVSLSDRDCGAVHSGWGMCELDAKGHVNQHLQSFEKSFYGLEGKPVLILENRAFRLAPGACGAARPVADRRPAGSRLTRHLSPERPLYRNSQPVNLLITGATPLGYPAIVENAHRGLLYRDTVTKPLQIGQRLSAFVRNIRPNDQIDSRSALAAACRRSLTSASSRAARSMRSCCASARAAWLSARRCALSARSLISLSRLSIPATVRVRPASCAATLAMSSSAVTTREV